MSDFYIGIPATVPEYVDTAYNVTGSNWTDYFYEIQDGGAYAFTYNNNESRYELGPDSYGQGESCFALIYLDAPAYGYDKIRINYTFNKGNDTSTSYKFLIQGIATNNSTPVYAEELESGSGSVIIPIDPYLYGFGIGFNKPRSNTTWYAYFTIELIEQTATGSTVTKSVAHDVDMLWVGVEQTVPTYETQTVTVTNSNVDNLFTVSHTSGGGFPWKSSNSRFQAGAGPSGTTNFTTTWTAKQDIDSLTFTYRLSKSNNTNTSYYFQILLNNTSKVKATSSVSGQTLTLTDIKKNDVITFKFTKSSSNTSYYAYFTASGTTNVQTGSTTKSVAMPVSRLYVGVNGVAQRVYFTYDDNY